MSRDHTNPHKARRQPAGKPTRPCYAVPAWKGEIPVTAHPPVSHRRAVEAAIRQTG